MSFADLLQYGLVVGHEKGSLAIANHVNPLSITEDEFAFMREYIARRGCRSGYEVATAFGVSACAIGLGMRGHGGQLVSMDAYIEEQHGNALAYRGAAPSRHPDADGYRIAGELLWHFALDNVELRVGWSPDDVDAVLGDRTLDFAFIDAAHFDRNLLADVRAIVGRLEPRSVVMLHDIDCFSGDTRAEVSEMLHAQPWRAPCERTFELLVWERG